MGHTNWLPSLSAIDMFRLFEFADKKSNFVCKLVILDHFPIVNKRQFTYKKSANKNGHLYL